jgi:exopolyphosphatase/guanosine-5'-triphosphate,3'-diphosphate pyrophosphatase
MRYASIDIGTNTVLMLICDVVKKSDSCDGLPEIRRLADFYEVPRVGEKVSISRRLSRDSMDRGIEVLRKYKDTAKKYGVETIVASATSAVREATNGNEFIDEIRQKLGIEVEVITGEVEARLGYLAAVSGATVINKPNFVIDIGGGSTELSSGAGLKLETFLSVDVGAVRVTEKFFVHNPPTDMELQAATGFIRMAVGAFPFHRVKPEQIFAVAGTATTIALISQGRYKFDADAVTNYRMDYEALRKVFESIRWKSSSEILQLTEAARGRADVLLAGALILMTILELVNYRAFFTTDRGLRYGYLLHKLMNDLDKF